MSLIGLSGFLERFKNLKPPKEFKKSVVQKIIQKHTGLFIETSKIEIKGTCVFLKISPLYKNEIFLHQEEIKEGLKEEGFQVTKIL